jgi:hypothetical protein
VELELELEGVVRLFCFARCALTVLLSLFTTTTILIRHGTGMKTGIHLEALVDAGNYVCRILKRDNQSKVARAILAKRGAQADE